MNLQTGTLQIQKATCVPAFALKVGGNPGILEGRGEKDNCPLRPQESSVVSQQEWNLTGRHLLQTKSDLFEVWLAKISKLVERDIAKSSSSHFSYIDRVPKGAGTLCSSVFPSAES